MVIFLKVQETEDDLQSGVKKLVGEVNLIKIRLTQLDELKTENRFGKLEKEVEVDS
jgi:hypothetical protein